MKIYIMAHGPTLKYLEDNIKEIDTKNVLWASLNKIAYPRSILEKIGQDLNYAYFSDYQFIDEYAEEILCGDFSGNKIKSIITSEEFMRKAIQKGKAKYFIPHNGQLIYSTHARGQGIDGRYYNSVTALLLTLISLGHREFGVFGLDGGPIGGDPLYCDAQGDIRDGISMKALENNLARDTAIMNEMFWKEVDQITHDRVQIINYSRESHVLCFGKAPIELAFK